MDKINPIWAQAIVSVVAIVGLVVVNVWGNESAGLNMILGTLLGGGAWGAVQRQLWPVGKDSSDLKAKEIQESVNAKLS